GGRRVHHHRVFFSSRRRHTRSKRDWSSDVCSSDLPFLGFEIKRHNPQVKWVAEFSDPLHKDVNAEQRYAPVEDDEYLERLKRDLDPEYHRLISDNVFNLCEVLPFIHADELIFTNTHQLEYMME